MLSVHLGSALFVDLIDTVGAAGTAWLRLSAGALVLLLLARPPLRLVRRRDGASLLGLDPAHRGASQRCSAVMIETVPVNARSPVPGEDRR